MREIRNRRGTMMIIVGVALVALVGFMAFAIDFGRMYLYRAQVHVSADAAALAATDRLARGMLAGAADTAVAYGRLNLVENAIPTITTSDIVPGVWNSDSSIFRPATGGNWSAVGNNAVQASARYTAGYVFGRLFGFTTRLRSATSVAAVGSVSGTGCVRPMVVAYQQLLDVLYPPAGSQTVATHPSLTAADVAALAIMTQANEITLAGKGNGPLGSGTFGGVRLPPIRYADGTSGTPWNNSSNNWEAGLGSSCADLATIIDDNGGRTTIGIGDQLAEDNGVATSAQSSGIETLCNLPGNGGTTPPNPGNNKTFSCNVPVPVKVAISSSMIGSNFVVKFIGVFAVTGYTKNTGIRGYFISLVSQGSFVPMPGPIKKVALVR